jgi:hypothetical protein
MAHLVRGCVSGGWREGIRRQGRVGTLPSATVLCGESRAREPSHAQHQRKLSDITYDISVNLFTDRKNERVFSFYKYRKKQKNFYCIYAATVREKVNQLELTCEPKRSERETESRARRILICLINVNPIPTRRNPHATTLNDIR